MHTEGRRSGAGHAAERMWRGLITLGFDLLYNELAWTYDLVSWLVSRGQWRAWQRSAIPYLAGETVLELAHGPGHMLLALESAGFRVTGLDLSPFMGRQAKRRTKHRRGRITLVRGKAQQLPFAGLAFENVLSTFPTEFLAERETLLSVHRVLRPGGRLVVVPQAQLTGSSALTRFLEWLYAITGQRPDNDAGDSGGFWEGVRERFEEAGFVLEVRLVSIEKSKVTVIIAHKSV